MKEYLFRFQEKLGQDGAILKNKGVGISELLKMNGSEIDENINFEYKVILPSEQTTKKYSNAIFLFHGLNERSWDKYIPWANYLCENTQVPILLFPISMHINRSPLSWSNPREMQRLVSIEKEIEQKEGKAGYNQNLTFVNYALSSRIKADPFRFYLAGRETIFNVCQFMEEIRDGRSPIFDKECNVNIFSYSIGSLLSQVLLMANPNGYFSKCKLFMFCGGSLFGEMNGNSRLIMDKISFETLNHYYRNQFIYDYIPTKTELDSIDKAFLAHIDKDFRQKERFSFYKKTQTRIKAISLKNDIVIPSSGIKNAIGSIWKKCLKEFDFPFKYSHEAPFPINEKGGSVELDYWFNKVFSEAALFLK